MSIPFDWVETPIKDKTSIASLEHPIQYHYTSTFGICVFLAMLLQLSGIDVLLFYMEELLQKVGTRISAADGTIIMGVVQVVTSCITPLVVDRLGRKLLMWTTSLGLTIFLVNIIAIDTLII
ncbi:Facilitated trehalose transporter Tret1 [Papilio machaon]|uniref:Facilitated trehalose transporter Tret1 n=1 Tax=Papilio machaon TaxID=76193 RepID=A0A0N1IQI9_PAPMA|nr:Facilitated trehalose transporter Tret1 [Papilio machaon]